MDASRKEIGVASGARRGATKFLAQVATEAAVDSRLQPPRRQIACLICSLDRFP